MIKFEATTYEEFEEEVNLRAHEISIETIKAVCDGIDQNATAVSLGFLTNLNLDIMVKSTDYLDALVLNIDRVAEMDEFELCAKATEYIKILKSKQV